jgi:hypothetical protein
VTLVNGVVKQVKVPGNATIAVTEKAFRDSGYTGDVMVLIAKAVPKTFELADVKTITKRSVNPLPDAIDDEYSEYTITLKSNTVIIVRGASGMARGEMREKPFRNAGYTGSVDELIGKVTVGSVLGASTSSPEMFIAEIESALEKLLLFFTE